MKQDVKKRQISEYINTIKKYFCLYLPVTGQRSESNDSDQSEEVHLFLKQEVSIRHIW